MIQYEKKLVYIVDDDPDDRQVILDAFLENNAEFDYVFIESANELLQILQETNASEYPSLILLDLNMPGMMGMQALKQIKGNKNFSRIPIVVLTTSTLKSDKKLSYEMGANCFISKPSRYRDLVKLTDSISKVWFQ